MAQWDSTSAEAARLVHGDRAEEYGHPADDYLRTAALFKTMTGIDLSVTQAITFMVCVKLSRAAKAMDAGFSAEKVRDTIVDGSGYLDCLWGSWELYPPTGEGE